LRYDGLLNMKSQLIITHPGSAHFDEVLAVSFIMAVHEDVVFHIERREPLLEELENPNTWVVDTGNRYEPEKRNFDHHQSLECSASFVLVAEYLGLKDTMSVMPWWRFKDEVDRFGPEKSSVKFDAGDVLVNKNPVEDWLTVKFSTDTESSLSLLRDFGLNIISTARLLKNQIDIFRTSRRLEIAGVTAIISETRESIGLEEYRRLEANPPDIVISLDRRDDGWRLFRYEGTPVDFTLIADSPEIAFAHKTGFLAKTKKRISIDNLTTLISRAVMLKK
jgi:hypothetical protein